MLWDASLLLQKDVIIGYSSDSGTFYNAHLQSPFTDADSRYRPDLAIGNTGLQGRWIFRLENNTVETLNYKGICLDWYQEQPDPASWSRTLGVCPCGFEQGRTDTEYGRGEDVRAQTTRASSARNSNNIRRFDRALLTAISELDGKYCSAVCTHVSSNI